MLGARMAGTIDMERCHRCHIEPVIGLTWWTSRRRTEMTIILGYLIVAISA